MAKEYSVVIVGGFTEYFMVHYIADVNTTLPHGAGNMTGVHDVSCSDVPHSRRLYENKHSKRIADLKQIIKKGDVVSINPLVYSGYCKRTKETLRVEVYLHLYYEHKLLKSEVQRRLKQTIEEASGFWQRLKIQLFGIKMSVTEQKQYLSDILKETIKYRQGMW